MRKNFLKRCQLQVGTWPRERTIWSLVSKAASVFHVSFGAPNIIVGFSGTNDAQYLLPVSIAQRDPENLHQTGSNAMVLFYLLQPENASYSVTGNQQGK
ncbi:hypothetical protein JVU11DRAFT_8503 [Chiua virens]|nr:hypothetical protein JVU11DRAFT_8503 [Chiua virens]